MRTGLRRAATSGAAGAAGAAPARPPSAASQAAARARRTAMPLHHRRNGQSMLFGWGRELSRYEKEHLQERLTVIALSVVVALVVLVFGGVLAYDHLIVPRRTVLRVDGQATTLGEYARLLSYKQNALGLEYQNLVELARRQMGADPSQNFIQQFYQQRAQQLQMQLSGLSLQIIEDVADARLIRAEAARRNIIVTPEEVDTEIKQLVGYQDPNATPVPAPATAVPAATPSGTPVEGAAPASETAPAVTVAPTAAPTTAATAATAAPTATLRNRRQPTLESVFRNYQRVTTGSAQMIRDDVEIELLRRKLNDELGKSVGAASEQVHARHILVPDETAASVVLERLKNGETFEALAAELSTDASNKEKGGDLGWFAHGAMVAPFDEAAFKLQPGETSGPVKTDFGVHIIQVLERDANREMDAQQLERARSGALDRWLSTARQEHKIERELTTDDIEWAARHARAPKAPIG